MAFGLNYNLYDKSSALMGTQIDIACMCWFTSTGKLTPLMIKIKDENEEIQTINNIIVRSSENTHYCSISCTVYRCDLIVRNIKIPVKIIYHKDENKWTMIIE